MPYREVRPLLLNEPDAARRRELYRRRCEVTEREHEPAAGRARGAGAGAGGRAGRADGAVALRPASATTRSGWPARHRAFLADTEALYLDELDRAAAPPAGRAAGEAGPQDLARLLRAPEFDAGFPGERALPALRATLSGLGIDLDRQPNVELDVAARPGKRAARLLRADPGARPGGAGGAAAGRPGGLSPRCSTRPGTPSTSRTPGARCRPSNGCWATTRSPRASPSCWST